MHASHGRGPVHVYLGDDVVWDIENDCAGSQEVEFVDFKDKKSGERKDPFTEGPKKDASARRIPESAGKQETAARRAAGRRKLHRHLQITVRVTDGGELDPELEVDGKKRR